MSIALHSAPKHQASYIPQPINDWFVMKTYYPLLLVPLIWCFAAMADTAGKELRSAPVPANYVVDAGDVLEISVWKDEGLNKQVLVRPDGGITFPLVGEIHAGGLTVAQIGEEITRRLSEYLSDPAVNVALITVNQKIYVVGKVTKPGEFIVPARVDVMQALSMAGGPAPFADTDDIKVIRRENGSTQTFPFDYDAVSQGEDLEQNIQLKRGDVVVVP